MYVYIYVYTHTESVLPQIGGTGGEEIVSYGLNQYICKYAYMYLPANLWVWERLIVPDELYQSSLSYV